MTLVSVVIPCFNHARFLADALDSVRAQTWPHVEAIVVDDGSTDDPGSIVNGYPDVRFIQQANRGLSEARNVGWRAARASVIAFTDDDCIPAPDWLMTGLTAVTRPEVGAVWGRVIVPLTADPTDWERNVAGLERAPCATANCFYRRKVLEAVGGFDERFTEAWREDSDLQFGALARDVTIVHEPLAQVTHPVRPAPWGISIALQRQNRFNALLYKKHPQLYRRYNLHEPPWGYYLTVSLVLFGGIAVVGGAPWLAALIWVGWIVMVAAFCLRRLRGANHHPAHVIEMIVTSVIIGPRTMDQLTDNLGCLDLVITAEDEDFIDGVVPTGEHSGKGFQDTAYPVTGRPRRH